MSLRYICPSAWVGACLAGCSKPASESRTETGPKPEAAIAKTPSTPSPSPSGAQPDAAKAVPSATLEAGKQAFGRGMCAKCHQPDGKGGDRAPDLTDDEWLHCDGSIDGILAVVTSGVAREDLKDAERPFAMNPATNLVPDEDDLRALAAFVHSLSAR